MLFISGKKHLLKSITDKVLLLHLYSNDVDLVGVKNVADFEQPINFKQRSLYDIFWSVEDEIAYIEEEVVFDAPVGKVYGYFTTVDNELLWAERFKEAPLNIENRGDKIKFDITLAMKECKE